MNVYLSMATGAGFSSWGFGDLSGPLHWEEMKTESSRVSGRKCRHVTTDLSQILLAVTHLRFCIVRAPNHTLLKYFKWTYLAKLRMPSSQLQNYTFPTKKNYLPDFAK